MLELDITQILDFLKNRNFNADFQKETNQIAVLLTVKGMSFPLFIKLTKNSPILQLILFLPGKLTFTSNLEVSRLLHFLNKEIDLPGFGMDETSDTLLYRASLLCLNNQLDSQLLEIHIKSIESVCEMFAPLILQVAAGKLTFQEFIKMSQGT